ncbi:hypothetical protein CA13_39420 [Planctomycetes bacterium CA13]|uniref:Uncharacterized protein n=1 Tax=Novipirellula herctigrandis TaxID=2527986 RepID=A0A5C5Z511_9BACT|nr:hypothetical protein CA13_39420 [Planctomycetes bacterium CA13]
MHGHYSYLGSNPPNPLLVFQNDKTLMIPRFATGVACPTAADDNANFIHAISTSVHRFQLVCWEFFQQDV